MKNEKWKYKVGGRARGIIPSLFLAVLFGGVSIYLYLDKQGIFLFSLLLTAIALVLVFVCIFRRNSSKSLLEKGAFFIRRNRETEDSQHIGKSARPGKAPEKV